MSGSSDGPAPVPDPLADLLRLVRGAREARTSDWPMPDEEWARIIAEWADRHYARRAGPSQVACPDAFLRELADASRGGALPRLDAEAVQHLGRLVFKHFQPRGRP